MWKNLPETGLASRQQNPSWGYNGVEHFAPSFGSAGSIASDHPCQSKSTKAMRNIPVIDLFAGPGGLGEGFASFQAGSHNPFRITLSVEKDPFAHRTLELRSFYRQFERAEVPDTYYEYLRGIPGKAPTREGLFAGHPVQAADAKREAVKAELGSVDDNPCVTAAIRSALERSSSHRWVLIGGPPCQVYSIAGRSRLRGVDPEAFDSDHRHVLYREYLRILSEFTPDVFVMENVKGILSASIGDEPAFARIRGDLSAPSQALGYASSHRDYTYSIYSLVTPLDRSEGPDKLEPRDFVIRSELHGVPQARHRVILLGIRSDVNVRPHTLCANETLVTASEVLSNLPRIRSLLSREIDTNERWRQAIKEVGNQEWFRNLSDGDLKERLNSVIGEDATLNTGAEFVPGSFAPSYNPDWYYDARLGGICNHSARSHMKTDLHRYLFAACFADVHSRSPKISDLPDELLPRHKNVSKAANGKVFPDRFRVQLAGRPSTTITCHLAKDGHYAIHFKPEQCRSLTVREAARLQTFPDNYFFEGPRTEQYRQVGNAVPPLLARQIASVVYDLIERADGAGSVSGIPPCSDLDDDASVGPLAAVPVAHAALIGHSEHRGARGRQTVAARSRSA